MLMIGKTTLFNDVFISVRESDIITCSGTCNDKILNGIEQGFVDFFFQFFFWQFFFINIINNFDI